MSKLEREPPDPMTYEVTVDLVDAEPRVWRRLEVAGDLPLDGLHAVLQIAMGWTDSHLHEFRGASSPDSPRGRRFAPPDPDEGWERTEPVEPESETRLDQLLKNVGDSLTYLYDFGDDWAHTVVLDAVLPRPDTDALPRCTAGSGACPPEDSGGIWGYRDLLAAAADPDALDPLERADFEERLNAYFPGLAASEVAAVAAGFNPDEVNRLLARPPLPGPIVDLLARASGPGGIDLIEMVDAADFGAPILIDAAVAARMVEPFVWLIRHVGTGLALTTAGYLKPADVRAVAEAIRIENEWYGAKNRESQTPPVLDFRQAAQKLGLLRATKGWVRVTKAGQKLAGDPLGLWWHLAARLPVGGAPHEKDAGLIALLATAADVGRTAQSAVMSAIGWRHFDGSPLSDIDVYRGSRATMGVLERMGVFARAERPGTWDESATRDGIAFVRAALRTWA